MKSISGILSSKLSEDSMKRLSLKNEAIWLTVALIVSLSLQPVYADESEFRLVGPISTYSTSQERYLGIFPIAVPDGSMSYWSRVRDPKHPGDYFFRPEFADSTSLTDTEFLEIENLLRQNVDDSYYDDFVLENLTGYEYTFADSAVWRREYHIRYARGDTVYVISGWLGKFFCFYRVVPGDFRYDTTDLQNEAEKISPSFMIAKEEAFTRIDEEINYCLEYVDKSNKMRIRNYQIDAGFRYGVSGDRQKKYNLIEITKFIDPEVMP